MSLLDKGSPWGTNHAVMMTKDVIYESPRPLEERLLRHHRRSFENEFAFQRRKGQGYLLGRKKPIVSNFYANLCKAPPVRVVLFFGSISLRAKKQYQSTKARRRCPAT